jgi:hypothetical protein
MSLFEISGKTALVTGATKGIGKGIVERMAEQGARVIISSRDQAACDALAAELNVLYGNKENIAVGIAADINNLNEMEQLSKESAARWGGLDILVCNAAILPFMGSSSETPPEQFDRILVGNQHHNFRLCQSVRPYMKKQGGGRIILIGSVSGLTPSPNVMAYAVAKAGVAHMARCLADEFAPENITVNCVAPGLVRSFSSGPLWKDPKVLKEVSADIPLGRIGEPDDIAGAVIFLASPAGSYISGATIPVDGGRAALSMQKRGLSAAHKTMAGTDFN